jgi:ADP-ribose pyrophosphatase YjhB (NUDIX family)
VDDSVLAPARSRYGEPLLLPYETQISAAELALVRRSTTKGRFHDVTFYVFNGDRLALIRKPHYEEGLWRPPGGGLRRGEPLAQGLAREALEELGVAVETTRYLLRAEATFTYGAERIPWQTHVLAAATEEEELVPLDTREISAARWGTLEELQGPIRELLLATGRPLWRYRVALHDATARVLGEGRS